MGFDCGFDIYPRLEPTTANKEIYRQFLDEIIRKYEHVHDDGKILEIPSDPQNRDKNFLNFMVGECPRMPYNPDRCDSFLRFSSKVSSNLTMQALPYIQDVGKIATKHFGNRVCFWHELNETGDARQWGHYSWDEISEADKMLKDAEEEEKKEREKGRTGNNSADPQEGQSEGHSLNRSTVDADAGL